MSGRKDFEVRAVSDEERQAAARRQREREREAARLAEARADAQKAVDRARAAMAGAQQQSQALAARVGAAQREMAANAAALRDLQARSEALSRNLHNTIVHAGAAADLARESAESARAEVDRLQGVLREASAEMQRAVAAQRQFDQQVLAPTRAALERASATLDELERSAAANLAVLAAMNRDATLGVLVNAMVDEADRAGLSIARAWQEGQDWELQFRDAEGRLFTLAAARTRELQSVKEDARLAVLIGESPEGDEACSLTVAQLVQRLRERGIAVTVRMADPDGTGVAGRRGEKERA